MLILDALEALKKRDFAAARDLIAREAASALTIEHFLIRGLAELSLEEWVAGRDTFAAGLERFPDHAIFWLNRGIAEENMGLIDAAIISNERCIALLPAQGEAAGNLSNLYRKKKRFAESEEMALRALKNGASRADALNSLGLALAKQGKHAEADDALREAQQAGPDNADIVANRANLAIDQLHFGEAWKLYVIARAIKDSPVYRRDEGMARLLAGDYARGWPLYEARLDMQHALRLRPPCPLWHGEDLRGKKLLLVAEQGFGDAVQFARYQEFLPETELVWAVPKPLQRLLSEVLRGKIINERDPLPTCDYYAPMMSLPLLTKQIQPPDSGHYLVAHEHPQLPPGRYKMKIGLVWAGSRTHERDHERSIPLEMFSPLIETTAADFYAPFIGDGLDEIGNVPVTRLSHLLSDFADAAALIKQMDCLITVDTVAAHLAGALGVKTFLLLPHCPDWRWGTVGETTPWYPSLTLLRQPKYGDWKSVMKRLRELLESGFGEAAQLATVQRFGAGSAQ